MKLGELNSAIRANEGAPKTHARIRRPDGTTYQLVGLEFTKQSVLNALKAAFPEGRGVETHLTLVNGFLVMEVPPGEDADLSPATAFEDPAAAEPETDFDDLLG